MEEFVVYILRSVKTEKLYKGCTSNLIARFKSHNELSTKGFTKTYRPWRVIYVKFFTDKTEALSHQKWLKTGSGREWIKNHVSLK